MRTLTSSRSNIASDGQGQPSPPKRASNGQGQPSPAKRTSDGQEQPSPPKRTSDEQQSSPKRSRTGDVEADGRARLLGLALQAGRISVSPPLVFSLNNLSYTFLDAPIA